MSLRPGEAEILTRMEVTGNAGGRKRRKAGSEESGKNAEADPCLYMEGLQEMCIRDSPEAALDDA